MWRDSRVTFVTRVKIADQARSMDVITVNELSLRVPLGPSHWPKPLSETLPQPIVVSLSVPYALATAGYSDQLADSVNYSSLSKAVEGLAASGRPFTSLEGFAEAACHTCFDKFSGVNQVDIRVEKLRGLLHAKSAGVNVTRHRGGASPTKTEKTEVFVRDLTLSTIIGIHPWERVEKQVVKVNLSVALVEPDATDPFDYRTLVESVSSVRPVTHVIV